MVINKDVMDSMSNWEMYVVHWSSSDGIGGVGYVESNTTGGSDDDDDTDVPLMELRSIRWL